MEAEIGLLVEKVRDSASIAVGTRFVARHGAVVGRDLAAAVVLLDKRVSRSHARLTCSEDGWWVENLSRFGTYLNREPVEHPTRLSEGDHLQVGGVLLRIVEQQATTILGTGPMSLVLPPKTEGLALLHKQHETFFWGYTMVLQPAPSRALGDVRAQDRSRPRTPPPGLYPP